MVLFLANIAANVKIGIEQVNFLENFLSSLRPVKKKKKKVTKPENWCVCDDVQAGMCNQNN